MMKTLHYAVQVYQRKQEWSVLIENTKARENSWKASAKKYEIIYQKVLGKFHDVEVIKK